MPTYVVPVVIVAAVALAALLSYAATRPDTFTVQRDTTVNAAAEKIYPLVADFRNWGQWSPYETRDPVMARTFGGASNGVGATYAWDGDRNVGAGRMEITEAAPPQAIAIKLDFSRPFEGHNVARFTFAPSGNSTIVTWAMHGPVPFVGRIMHIFFNMDRMVGGDFEAGLAKLKKVSEQ